MFVIYSLVKEGLVLCLFLNPKLYYRYIKNVVLYKLKKYIYKDMILHQMEKYYYSSLSHHIWFTSSGLSVSVFGERRIITTSSSSFGRDSSTDR